MQQINIPLPTSTRRIDQNYSIKDVVKAFETILKFTKFKEKIDKIITHLASVGVSIDVSSFSNPNMLIKQLMSIRKSGYDVDVEEIINELNSLEDIKLDEIEKSVEIIKSFISISRNVSLIMTNLSKTTTTTKEELDMLKSLFNIGNSKKLAEHDTDEPSISEEEKESIREEIRKILSER